MTSEAQVAFNGRLKVQLTAAQAMREALEKDLTNKRKRNIELTVENEQLKNQRLEDQLARDLSRRPDIPDRDS